MPAQIPEAGAKTIKKAVEEKYAAIARGEMKSCCSSAKPAPEDLYNIATMAQGYSSAELAAVPEGANLGLGCGDPTADAGLLPGHTVLDLGSGAGVDCFLAARRVSPEGRVIGVDMTEENERVCGRLRRRPGVAEVAHCRSLDAWRETSSRPAPAGLKRS